MRTRIVRTLSTTVSLLLLVAIPTQAGPIKFVDVINVMGDLQRGGQIQQLKLRTAPQDPSTKPVAGSTTSPAPGVPAVNTDPLVATTLPTGDVAVPSLNAGTAMAQQPQGDVQVFSQDSVDGTVCDCGEIPSAGGMPWWPFLALIPLVCLTGVCTHHHDTPTPTPTPGITPNNPQITPFCVNCNNTTVPEPTSLLLLGTGIVALGAGARRRLTKARAKKEAGETTEA